MDGDFGIICLSSDINISDNKFSENSQIYYTYGTLNVTNNTFSGGFNLISCQNTNVTITENEILSSILINNCNSFITNNTIKSQGMREGISGSGEKIFIYKKRVAPIGKIINRKFIEIKFKDETTLDTYYLIEQYHHDSFIKAIQKESNNQIEVYQKQLK